MSTYAFYNYHTNTYIIASGKVRIAILVKVIRQCMPQWYVVGCKWILTIMITTVDAYLFNKDQSRKEYGPRKCRLTPHTPIAKAVIYSITLKGHNKPHVSLCTAQRAEVCRIRR